MFTNHLKVAIRNLLKYRAYTFINITGLAVGMTCCLLILLYVQDELSYDRYHEKADQIYRVTLHGRLAGNDIDVPHTCVPLAATLVDEYPEVLYATRFRSAYGTVLVSRGEKRFNEERVFYADSTYFDVFTLPLIKGNPETALTAPYSVILTEETARKYFGDANPIGQTLTFNNETDYLVTAVSENVPHNSHFHFDFLASFVSLSYHNNTRWISNNLYTYIVLQKNIPASQLIAKLPGLIRKYVAPQIQQAMGITYDEFIKNGGEYTYSLQRVTDIHLYSKLVDEIEPGSSAAYVTIFSIIAFFILILACINFMNLATARSANRAREVGIRKVLGSHQMQLVRQFLTESILLSIIALILAIFLSELFLPKFNDLAAKYIQSNYLTNGLLLPALIAITVFVGFLAGSYPAFFLSAFRPVAVLKGAYNTGASGRSSLLRKILVVFQFAISIILLIGTFVVYNQLQYIRNKQLGFNKEQVVIIQRARALGDRLSSFENELKQNPAVISTAATRHLPGRDVDHNAFQPEDTPLKEGYLLATFSVGYDFMETLGIELAAGRSFSRKFSTDFSAYIINEAAMKKFGWQDAVGKTIIEPDPEGPLTGQVIAVMKDFHFESLHHEIRPALLRLSRGGERFLAVKISGRDVNGTLAYLKRKWSKRAPDQPFEYTFLDEDFDKLYRADQRVGRIIAT
ncbi:MAG: ABC transporter permease, partial [bacterium]